MTATPATLQSSEPTARPSRKGLIVVVVVCVLATALAFTMAWLTTDWSLAPKQRLAMEQIRRMQGFIKMYQRTMGRFPTEQEGFKPLLESKVLDAVPTDPWGRPYVYQFNEQYAGVVSYGADGAPGGEGEDADINSRGLVRAQR
jgi:general secretion pathway protein G